MRSAAYYRAEAERARASADNNKDDPKASARWLSIANGYEALAVKLEVEEAISPAMPPPPRGGLKPVNS
jgi:hypothetical protein